MAAFDDVANSFKIASWLELQIRQGDNSSFFLHYSQGKKSIYFHFGVDFRGVCEGLDICFFFFFLFPPLRGEFYTLEQKEYLYSSHTSFFFLGTCSYFCVLHKFKLNLTPSVFFLLHITYCFWLDRQEDTVTLRWGICDICVMGFHDKENHNFLKICLIMSGWGPPHNLKTNCVLC